MVPGCRCPVVAAGPGLARSDWELTTEPIPVPGPGEFVVAVSYLSVDPGMRRCDVIDYDMIVIGAPAAGRW